MDANRTDFFSYERALFHMDRYTKAGNDVAGMVVLDAACGTGYGADKLAQHGAKSVYGLDCDPKAVEYAKKKYAKHNVTFQCGSILELPFVDGMFDVYVSLETIEHVKEEDIILKEASRVLREGGIYIVSTPNSWGLENSPFHVRDYDYDSILKSLTKHFKPRIILNQNSGMNSRFYNHGQKRGFVETTEDNKHLAECFFAVFEKIN